ncbi:hypothetical protein CCP2SC5_470001 [Azospirillaceae bacterium]
MSVLLCVTALCLVGLKYRPRQNSANTGMTDSNEDRTVAFGEFSAKDGSIPKGPSQAMVNAPKARLTCLDPSLIESPLPGNGVIHLAVGAEQTIGRGETCTYPISSRKLSRQHARIFAGVGVWGIEDLNSTNGVQVNRQKVKTAWLKHDDEVKIGPIPFKFELERPDLSNGAARSAASADDDGDGEHTMMAGSSGAASAIIAAARKAEDAPQQVSLVPPPRPTTASTAASAKSGGGKGGLIAVIAVVLIGVGVGGFLYYPTLQRESKIKAIVEQTQLLSAGADEARMTSVIAEAKQILDQNKGHPVLSGAYAKALFQRFESSYLAKVKAASEAPAFEDAVWKAIQLELNAFKQELDEISKQVDEAARAAKLDTKDVKKEELTQSVDLVNFLDGLTKYHIFAKKNAQVGAIATPSVIRELKALDEFKDSYKALRRKLNSVLTVDHKALYALVQDVETKDRVIIDGWRDVKPGN